MAGNIRRHQRPAQPPRLKGRDLLVQRAHAGALRIVQHRTIHRPRHMVQRKLARTAHINPLIQPRRQRLIQRHLHTPVQA